MTDKNSKIYKYIMEKINRNIDALYYNFKTWYKNKNISTLGIISLIISSSGWVAFIYSNNVNQPNLRAKVFQAIQGEMVYPEYSNHTIPIFTFYICVVNEGHYPDEILNYQIQVCQNGGYKNLTRLYNIQNQNFTFTSEDYYMYIDNLDDKLIYLKHGPLSYGEAKHGFILYSTDDPSINIYNITEYRIIITDVYNKKYLTTTKPSEFITLYELNDIADIQIFEKR